MVSDNNFFSHLYCPLQLEVSNYVLYAVNSLDKKLQFFISVYKIIFVDMRYEDRISFGTQFCVFSV
jgi:hypothetical protein